MFCTSCGAQLNDEPKYCGSCGSKVVASKLAMEIALEYPEEYENDKDVMLAAVNIDGNALEHASEELKCDKDIVQAAVSNDGYALQYASEELKNDRDIVLAAVSNNGCTLQYASRELKADKKIVLAALDLGPTLKIINSIRYDREIAERAMSKIKTILGFASDELRNNKSVVLIAINNSCGFAFEFASGELRDNKEIALAAVRECGCVLQYASRRLRNDKDIVLAAVRCRTLGGSIALQYASDLLKAEQEMVDAATAQDAEGMDSAVDVSWNEIISNPQRQESTSGADQTPLAEQIEIGGAMRITDAIAEWLKEKGWEERPEVDEENQSSITGFLYNVADDLSVTCFLDAAEKAGFIKLTMYFLDPKIPTSRIDEVIKYTNEVNVRNVVGQLAVMKDKTLRWYSGIDVEGATIETRLIENLLGAGLSTLERRLPQFMAVCFAGKTAEEALEIE